MSGRLGDRSFFFDRRDSAGVVAILVVALLIVAGYAAFAGFSVYQDLENGCASLVAAQASLVASERSGDQGGLQSAAAALQQAEHDFGNASQRVHQHPALRLAAALPGSGAQIDGAARLGAIGADLSRAGEAATAV